MDGTNIIRSYAAIGREFPFPIDIEPEPITQRDNQNTGGQTLTHVDATFPLFKKQREISRQLNEDRRVHHRELKNQGRKMQAFAPGDLVIVRKQMTTTEAQGPAKTRLKARGPYRIIEQVRDGTYKYKSFQAFGATGDQVES